MPTESLPEQRIMPLPTRRRAKRSLGFSLIELMVGMTVALLTTVVIFKTYQSYEGQRRTTGATSDATVNGQYVMHHLEREMAQAGWGFQFGRVGVGCNFTANNNLPAAANIFSIPGGGTTPMYMVPVMIIDGAGTAPDSIRVMHTTASTAVPALGSFVTPLFSFDPKKGDVSHNFTQGNMALLMGVNPGQPCGIYQVTNSPTYATGMRFDSGASNCVFGTCPNSAFNPTTALTAFWAADLGTLSVNTYSVVFNAGSPRPSLNANTAIIGNSYDSARTLLTGDGYVDRATAKAQQTEIAQDIVNLQAQYGLDTTKDAASSVNSWVNATGNYAPNNLNVVDANLVVRAQHIRAIRLLVITRSAQPEKPNSSGNCNAATGYDQPTSGAAVRNLTWPDGSTISVDLSQGATGIPWNCYRYQTFMNVIPLRNTAWNGANYEI